MNDSPSFLQRFFDASLIPSDTTDERLKHYHAAAADLAKRFLDTPLDAVSASRVAIDPSCPAADPWFVIVQDAVKVHWKTFLMNNNDAPRQICRGILLEALKTAADKEEYYTATAIWNATSSLAPHLGNGPEQTITRAFISDLGDNCESQSSLEWRIGADAGVGLPDLDLKLAPIKPVQVDEEELKNGMSDAVGQHDQSGNNHGDPNPYWANSTQNWSYQFAPRAAKAVATSVNKALASTSPAIKGLTDQLPPALKKHTNALRAWVVESLQRNEKFTKLLWWKQALYSPSLQLGYRDLSPGCAAIALAYDLVEVSDAPVPLSVEFFLRETVRAVVPKDPPMTLSELVGATKASAKIEACLPNATNNSIHRISLREFLSLALRGPLAEESFAAYIGIGPTTKLTLSAWAVWLYRDRLADVLTDADA